MGERKDDSYATGGEIRKFLEGRCSSVGEPTKGDIAIWYPNMERLQDPYFSADEIWHAGIVADPEEPKAILSRPGCDKRIATLSEEKVPRAMNWGYASRIKYYRLRKTNLPLPLQQPPSPSFPESSE
jgi:hypothetical protein